MTDREAEKKRLNRIRSELEHVPTNWTMELDGDQLIIKASPPSGEGADPFPAEYARMHENDQHVALFVIGAHTDKIFLLDLLDRAIETIKRIRQPGQHQAQHSPQHQAQPDFNPKDYAAQCAMACDKPLFQEYMAECFNNGELPADKEETANLVRKALNIKSRSELNASQRWLELNHNFTNWQKGRTA